MKILIASGKCDINSSLIRNRASLSDFVIAADDGFKYLFNAGVIAHTAIGDFDSSTPEDIKLMDHNNVERIVYPADKDKTDTELALDLAMQKNPSEITLLTTSAGRIDHYISNFNMMAECVSKRITSQIYDGINNIIFTNSNVILDGFDYRYISIIALKKEIIIKKTEGLHYELNNSVITFGSSLGISNFAISPVVKIEIENGIACIIQSNDKEANQ